MATFTYTRSEKTAPDAGVRIDQFLRKNWFECLIILALLYLVMCRNVSFTIGYSAPQAGMPGVENPVGDPQHSSMGILTGLTEQDVPPATDPLEVLQVAEIPAALNTEDQDRLAACQRFITRFAKVAIAEQEKYQIPASVILGQALLASKAGESPVASQANNFFAASCGSGTDACITLNGAPYQVFSTPWESFRANSLLLQSAPYQALQDLAITDYRAWASGLVETGLLYRCQLRGEISTGYRIIRPAFV
jgi:hypothetical protein